MVSRNDQPAEDLEAVTIRFCGDSGDGMQLTGSEFTKSSALAGNDLATFPDFPAEIRAPAGTLPGVSGFQVQFSSREIYTPGDAPDVLVCMNPAALKTNLHDLVTGGIQIVNSGAFTEQHLQKSGYAHNPLEDDSLEAYRTFPVDIQKLTQTALAHSGLGTKEITRAKNMFALGLVLWMYSRTLERPIADIKAKFAPRLRKSPTPTSRFSRPASPTARPPRPSLKNTRSSRQSSPRASIATSPATRPLHWVS